MAAGDDFLRELALYTQPDGFQSPDFTPGVNSTGNPCLYSAYARIVASRLGVAQSMEPFWKLVSRLEVRPGLIRRKPGSDDQNSTDEYVAATAVSESFALRVLHYGLEANPLPWFFNNSKPGKIEGLPFDLKKAFTPWFGRRLEFVAHVCWSAGYTPSKLDELYAANKLERGGVETPTGCLQDYLRIMKGAPRSGAMREAARNWDLQMRAQWGTNEYMRLVLAHELGKDDLAAGLKHPVSSYWVEVPIESLWTEENHG